MFKNICFATIITCLVLSTSSSPNISTQDMKTSDATKAIGEASSTLEVKDQDTEDISLVLRNHIAAFSKKDPNGGLTAMIAKNIIKVLEIDNPEVKSIYLSCLSEVRDVKDYHEVLNKAILCAIKKGAYVPRNRFIVFRVPYESAEDIKPGDKGCCYDKGEREGCYDSARSINSDGTELYDFANLHKKPGLGVKCCFEEYTRGKEDSKCVPTNPSSYPVEFWFGKFDAVDVIRLDDKSHGTSEMCCLESSTPISPKNCEISRWDKKKTYLYPNDQMPLGNKYMCCVDQVVVSERDKNNIPGIGRCNPLNSQFATLKMTPKSSYPYPKPSLRAM